MAAAAQERINRGIREAADRIEGAAHRLDEVVGERLDGAEGPVARAGEAGHSLADGLESVAGYLRSKDVETVGRDLARQARERPVRTLLVGLAAGWLLGKITR